MYDRSAIMTAAWKEFRRVRSSYSQWQFDQGYIDGSFSQALKVAWRLAKADAARKAEQARIDTAVSGSPRAASIVRELERLPYADFRIDIHARRNALNAELMALAA